MIKVNQFCALATSPAWQAWLYHFDNDLYKRFITKLHKSGGCTRNSQIMAETLDEIDDSGRIDELYGFLKDHYPYVLDKQKDDKVSIDKYNVFDGYVPGVLTFPHRLIVRSDNPIGEVKKITAGKGVYDFVIIKDHLYIEYLEKNEKHLLGEIPAENWLTTKWKKNNQR